MQDVASNRSLAGWQAPLLAAAITGAPVAMMAMGPSHRLPPTAVVVVGVIAGALLLVATLTFYLHWLTAPRPHHGWVITAMVVMSSHVMVGSGLGLVGLHTGAENLRRDSLVDLMVPAIVVTLVLLSARGSDLPDPLLVGLGLSAAVTALQVAVSWGLTLEQPSPALAIFVMLTIMGGHVSIGFLVWHDHDLPGWARRRLALAVGLIGAANAPRTGLLDHWASDLVVVTALVAAALLWTSTTWFLLRQLLDDQHRLFAGLEVSMLEFEASWRGDREQLHEIRSTVAGAANACRLLSKDAVGTDAHARLERVIRAELDRLERLVTGEPPSPPGPVDIDATLDVLLESHRARGRTIAWEPTGETVYARPDDVAEALNILIDNAATHGGAASGIAVTRTQDLVLISVSDAGPGVPPEWRERIFDWGVRGAESLGQGIGLNLARRLVSEHGGSLSLAEPSTGGSSFVIKLPAARRSEENHVRDLE